MTLSTSDPVLAAFDGLVSTGVKRRELDRGGRFLRWIEVGTGPAVVFESGAMSPVAGFAAVFKELAADHRLIAYDRAGYGVSDAVPLDLELQIGDLIAILEEAGQAVLVGHSWGGLLAQLAAWQRPELINGLVLVDASHEHFWAQLPPEVRTKIGQHPDRSTPAGEDPRSTELLEQARELAAEVSQSVGGDPLLEEACLSYLATDEQLFTYLDEVPMALDHLDQITVRRSQSVWPKAPVVLLTATKGRPEAMTVQVLAIQEQVRSAANGRHLVVPDSGHYIHLDRPDLVISSIREVEAQNRDDQER
jgi:pimeloyl-ACP methyl ester carboxylesterase